MKHWLGLVAAACVALSGATAHAAPGEGQAGEPAEPDDAYVVGGTVAPEGKWPDAAAIIDGGSVICTGVLIAPQLVLTAGHCMGGIDQVRLGVTDYRDSTGETISVAQEISYPQWWSNYDIGVLVLSQPSAIEPRALALDCAAGDVADGAEVAIVGYGATDANASQFGTELREAFTTITDADCSNLDKGCASAVSPGGEIGAGGEGIDSCSGDSGGPLYLLSERGPLLVGITSRAYSDATLPCSQGGIYVRPDAVVDWIESESGLKATRPICNFAPAPIAQPLEVRAGETERADIEPNDPDATDTHHFEIAASGEHGVAEIGGDGSVLYTADDDYEGPDEFVVRVVDSGDPPQSAEVTVLVTVLPPDGGCLCRTSSGGPSWPILLAVGWLAARRRRRAR